MIDPKFVSFIKKIARSQLIKVNFRESMDNSFF